MCEPATATLVMMGIATAVGAAGTAATAVSQNNAAKAQAKVAKYEVQQIEQNTQVELERHRRRVLDLLGTQRVQGAGQGFIINAGSNFDIQSDTLELGEFDALTIKSNAERDKWALRSGASQTRAAGRTALVGGSLDAAGGLLSGAAKTYGKGIELGAWGKP